jgi:hypothetical protein
MRDRFVRWLYGMPNIAGSVLALAGLGLFLGGVISGVLVGPIVVGLYAIGAVATPRPRGLGAFTLSGDLDAGQIKNALNRIVSESGKRLPPELAAKVTAIQATILDVLPKVTKSSIDRRDLFALERTVSDYLPHTLDNYLTLPRTYADGHAVQDGKTPKQLLAVQLDLIDEKMREISDAVAKDDVDKLLAQGRFLEDRFGKTDDLTLPSPEDRPAVKS